MALLAREPKVSLFQETPNVADIFGISLLHRHFDMDPEEVLVEYGRTSSPWQVPEDPSNYMDGSISPRSWCFSGDSGLPEPYEYEFKKHASTGHDTLITLTDHAEFVTKLGAILDRHDLKSTLGLMAITPDYLQGPDNDSMLCERTFGKANVVFNIGRNAVNSKGTRTSVWVFGKRVQGGQEAMLCFGGCGCHDR
ncbi:hypothetical protein ANO11243_076050 [Dothideomycetidae sp. 11243]|nr:hypothetical protein ANO11243_076050 [fungal sp. No.11243]